MKLVLSRKDLQQMAEDGNVLSALLNKATDSDLDSKDTPESLQVALLLLQNKALSVRPTLFGGVVIEIDPEYSKEASELLLEVFGEILPHLVGLWKALTGKSERWQAFHSKWFSK